MSEMSWPAKNNWKLRWRSARRVARTFEVCGRSVIQLQPVDLDLRFERLEFAVAGYQLGISLFSQGRGKGVGVGNFVAGFVFGGFKDHGPVDVDALDANLPQLRDVLGCVCAGISSGEHIPDLAQVDAGHPEGTPDLGDFDQ